MSTSAKEAFAKAELFTDEIVYTAISLPAAAIWAGAGVLAELGLPFSVLIADKDEVTLIMPLEAWQDYTKRLPDARQQGEFRLITFDLALDFDLVGFMAYVSGLLAEAEVSILPYAAFERDHLLVPRAAFAKAWQTLKAAQERKTE